jgi:hypothetical protein
VADTTTDAQPVFYIEPADRDGIPFDVFSTLSTLLTAAWPDAAMAPGRHGRGMGLVLPTRKAKRVSKKDAGAAVVEPDPDSDEIGVIGWDGESMRTSTPEDLAKRLGLAAYLLLAKTPGAVNYIEQQIAFEGDDGKTHHLVFHAAWSPQQTPDQLRRKAEGERDLLAQAMWDARAALGFDNDGDSTPAAAIAGGGFETFARNHVEDAKEQRRDYDEALSGTERANAAAVAAFDGNALIQQAHAERDELRDTLSRVKELAGEWQEMAKLPEGSPWIASCAEDLRAALDACEAPLRPTHEQVWQAMHGTDEPWGGCADSEAVERIMALFGTR